jgi:hypothetical protein
MKKQAGVKMPVVTTSSPGPYRIRACKQSPNCLKIDAEVNAPLLWDFNIGSIGAATFSPAWSFERADFLSGALTP